MAEQAEQRLVEQLVTQSADEGLGKRVLLWFARRDVVPVQDRHAGELRPVVRDAHRRTTTNGSGRVELAYYPASRTARNGYRCAGALAASGLSARGRQSQSSGAPNQRWSIDFASDALSDGRRFRILTIVDDLRDRVRSCNSV